MPNRHARREDSTESNVAAAARLTAELRRRLADAVYDARRRTARDIQAGVLQRLAAMRIHVSSTIELMVEPDAAMDDIGRAIDAAMAELRETISTAVPAFIATEGLGSALRSSGIGAPLPLVVRDDLQRRHPLRAEQAIYYVCHEATQNAIKHAGKGASVTITLSDTRAGIDFVVADNGAGFEPAAGQRGVGLLNIRERIESAGGEVAIWSSPGLGAAVRGFVPDVLSEAVRAPRGSAPVALDDNSLLRSQILAETDAERHRIVRDLHDGAQQRLVALRVKITLATDGAAAGTVKYATLQRLGTDLDLAIAELRDLARSLRTPSDETALGPALRWATRHWRMEVRVRERNLERHDQAVEHAIYGCVLEALQEARAQRGALPGARAVVSLFQAPDAIHFVIRDGFAESQKAAQGDHDSAGHMLDRAAMVGGSVSVQALPGRSVVRGSIPIAGGA